MTTGCLGSIGVEIVFVNQRTVKLSQSFQFLTLRIGGGVWQWATHNLPSMTVEQHEHRRYVGTLNIEGAVAHVEGLEPVFYILHNFLF